MISDVVAKLETEQHNNYLIVHIPCTKHEKQEETASFYNNKNQSITTTHFTTKSSDTHQLLIN